MNYDTFIERCENELSKNDKQYLSTFVKNVNSIFGENHYSLTNKISIISLFCTKRGLGKTQFYKIKNIVKIFYSDLFEKKLVDEETLKYVESITYSDIASSIDLSCHYFSSLDSCLNYISRVGEINGFYNVDDLLIFKSIIILSWYGIDLKDVVKIKKTDLHKSQIVINNKTLEIPDKYYDILVMYSMAEYQDGFPSHKKQYLKYSQYLFRSSRQDQLVENNILCLLKRFNEESAKYGKTINVSSLKKNSVFCRVLDLYGPDSSLKQIQQFLECDKPFAFGYNVMYQQWKELYLNKKEG